MLLSLEHTNIPHKEKVSAPRNQIGIIIEIGNGRLLRDVYPNIKKPDLLRSRAVNLFDANWLPTTPRLNPSSQRMSEITDQFR